jgi:hypothetical protein
MSVATVTPKPQAAPAKPSRMSLGALVKGKIQQPTRVVLYGVEGIGKSTFGANAPSPIFIGAEDGTSQLDVTRFPAPESWQEVLDAVRVLANDEHEYKTLVLDTLDWAEPLLWAHICQRDKQESIEAYGYGKGYQAALDEWRIFLAALERMSKAKRMHVVLLAHSWIKPFKNPEGDDFDRYEMKLHAKAAGLIKEWSDCVLFANHETFAQKDSKTKRVRGLDTGARLLFTQRRAAFDAKNRYGLPDSIPLSWADFEAGMQSGEVADPAVLKAEIERKLKILGGDMEKSALVSLSKAGNNPTMLAQLNNWASAKVAAKENA